MSLTLLLLLPFVGSALAACLPTRARNLVPCVAGARRAGGPGAAWRCSFPTCATAASCAKSIAWLPSLGLDLVVRVDGFAWMFAVLVTGIGLLVVALRALLHVAGRSGARASTRSSSPSWARCSASSLSGNLVQLVVFWELTSLFSFLLIGYWHHRVDARRGARMALDRHRRRRARAARAACCVLGHIVGSYDLDAVLASGDAVRAHALYPVALVLVLLGAFTKSAQFPFHFWLPHAMAAPTPVSAYLHSATMVKAGVFLLARLWPVLVGHRAVVLARRRRGPGDARCSAPTSRCSRTT